MIESSQVIAEMIAMAKEMQAAMKRHQELGLNPDEEAFYDALADRPEVLLNMGDTTLKKLASELTEKLRNSTTVDWQFRDSVRAKMRILIRQLLRKYKYPPKDRKMRLRSCYSKRKPWRMPGRANQGRKSTNSYFSGPLSALIHRLILDSISRPSIQRPS